MENSILLFHTVNLTTESFATLLAIMLLLQKTLATVEFLTGTAWSGDRSAEHQAIERAQQKAGCNIMANTVALKSMGKRCGAAEFSLYARDGGRKYVNRAERLRVLKAMAALDADKALFSQLLAWTGARVSEVLALTAASFQIESSIVAFRTLKRRRHHVREVPIPKSLMMAIAKQYDLHRMSAPNQRLWTWHRVTVWRFLREAMHRAGVHGRPACPRGLRHGFGVGTLQAGVPLNLVQRWLGHAKIATTAIYADASGPEERTIASRFWNLN